MTIKERLEEVIHDPNTNLNSCSDEELEGLDTLLNLLLVRVRLVRNGRAHYRNNFPPSKKDDE